MPMNAYRDAGDGGAAGRRAELPAELPMDLQLDLLVDGELPEGQRRELLRQMEQDRAWRPVALRFLERQSEKQTVRKLMAGGSVVPAEVFETVPPTFSFPGRWVTLPGLMTAAAGLLIAAISALVTFYVASPAGGGQRMIVYEASLPGSTVGVSQNIPISVDVVKRDGNDVTNVFPAGAWGPDGANGSTGNGGSAGARRSVVIQPDGQGNFVVFPVNTMKVY